MSNLEIISSCCSCSRSPLSDTAVYFTNIYRHIELYASTVCSYGGNHVYLLIPATVGLLIDDIP